MKWYQRIFLVLRALGTLSRIFWQMGRGLWRISSLPLPCVSIFGSSRQGLGTPESQKQAALIARELVQKNISVLTGGGPGIMEAANCGARATSIYWYRTMKIAIRGLPASEAINTCAGPRVVVDDFFTRKWLLFSHSIGFVVFPGGLGTLDELSDLMNLIATRKLQPRLIVLMGTAHWAPYWDFIQQAIADGYIDQAYMPRVLVTDDVDAAIDALSVHCDNCTMVPSPDEHRRR